MGLKVEVQVVDSMELTSKTNANPLGRKNHHQSQKTTTMDIKVQKLSLHVRYLSFVKLMHASIYSQIVNSFYSI